MFNLTHDSLKYLIGEQITVLILNHQLTTRLTKLELRLVG